MEEIQSSGKTESVVVFNSSGNSVLAVLRASHKYNWIILTHIVACITTIRVLIALNSINNLVIYQIDVKTAFLNDKLRKYIWNDQKISYFKIGIEKSNVILGIKITINNRELKLS
ncbi:hypothetical protein OSB04_025427 [Centaurea solstitialis]|uniref:Reverse transcriptase Ty1/copia-type domain-containing protein n=1 Tax=Centaurea solstitialis TaxID=347529 RepID=A0AA38WBA7_9ASTR|nr:hypothetical protein OSB04_025427 [Centaurea solstitialis]